MSAEQRKKKAKWGEVTCTIHGREMANNPWKPKQVKTPVPTKRADKYSGCPFCNGNTK